MRLEIPAYLSIFLTVVCCVELAAAATAQPPTPCTLPVYNCFVDPCSVNRCPAHPTATCRSNYCGGCNAQFFVNGIEVTAECGSLACPPPGFGGICTEQCRSNADCSSGYLCCSNGCGHACMQGVAVVTPSMSSFSTSPPTPPLTRSPPPTKPLSTSPPFTPPLTTSPPTQDCKLVRCPLPLCSDGAVPRIMPGDCCASCPPPTTGATSPDCSTVLCARPNCLDGATPTIPPGQCCPVCPSTASPATITPAPPTRDCRLIQCSWPRCPDGAIPVTMPGDCCPSCPPPTTGATTPDCPVCALPYCGDGVDPIFPPGRCRCAVCPPTTGPISTPSTTNPIDCSVVRCAYPRCLDGATRFTPVGQCCPRCPSTVCSAPVYPPDSIRACLVVVRRWTFRSAGGCREIRYSPCGQEEEGYNVFIDLESCQAACGPPVTSTTEAAATTSLPVRVLPQHVPICPRLDSSRNSSCSSSCTSDANCPENQMCCSSSCGRTCMIPDSVPYYSVPMECPNTHTSDLIGTCNSIRLQSCRQDSDCSSNQLCCRNGGCGQFCMNAIASTQPCFALRQLLTGGSPTGGIPGAFIPMCQDDGTFTESQFFGSTGFSWCVNVKTGYPVSPFYPRGSTPQCSRCSNLNRTYAVGQSFPASDGCNTCFCQRGGQAGCTEIGCISPCSLPPSPGPCRAAIPAFYYDHTSRSCRQFTYGGCGGNANKFQTVADCLTSCAPSSGCLLPRQTGLCLAHFPSFFFNSSSGMCEKFVYGGCGGNANRFSSGPECLRACSPDSPPNRCWNSSCGTEVLRCPPGSEVIRDAQHCCPYCRPSATQCRESEFRCLNGDCIPRSQRCDFLRDCPGGEDELNCQRSCDFRCGDGHCIDRSYVCDSRLDCTDRSDMQNCSMGLRGVVYLQPSDIPQQCPNANNLPSVCGEHCRTDSECGEGEMCCLSNCGRSCVKSIPVTPICRSKARQVQQTGLIGAFQPSCQEDGSFSEMQCYGSTGFCWCVDVETGQPVSNGIRGAPQCRRCVTPNGDSVSVGASFSSSDGCNTCMCTSQYGVVCTTRPCVTKSCRLGKLNISHNSLYRDECSYCLCLSGSLRCNRSRCSRNDIISVTVNMTFNGNFDSLMPVKAEVIREVKKMLVSKYRASLSLQQDQIRNINLFKGSVVVMVTLEAANITGANLTLLFNQLKHDYLSGDVVIRLNSTVLVPTGIFQDSETPPPTGEPGMSSSLLWWHYLLICVGAVMLLSLILIIVTVVIARNSPARQNKSHKVLVEESVSFKRDDSEVAFQT